MEQETLGIVDANCVGASNDNYQNKVTRTLSCAPTIRVTSHDTDSINEEDETGTTDADGTTQAPCKLHRRSALRRVQTLNEPGSPRQGRPNRRRSPSTPNVPDPNMLQRNQDTVGGKDTTKFHLTFEIEGAREKIRLPARRDLELKNVLEEALSKKGLTLADVDIYIQTSTNPLPKYDKSLKTPTEHLGGFDVFIRPAVQKTSPADGSPADEPPGTTKQKKKDLSAFLGVKDELNPKVGSRDRRMSVPAIVSAQMDPKLIKLQKELDHYSVQGLPGFPPLLSLQYNRSQDEDPTTFHLEESWKDFIDADIVSNMTKKGRELQEGIWELARTEAKYIRQIRVIIDLYMCCLLNLQTEAILNEIETEKIFSNVTALEAAHSSFWKESLKKVTDKARDSGKPLDPVDIATAFEGFAERFIPYFKFCIEEESCLEYVREKTKENDLLRAFFEWCEQHPMSRKLRLRGLSDLLVYPMQRVTKYHLMVERVYKNTEDDTAKAALKVTFEEIVEFVSHVNHEIKKEQERKKMERVARSLEGYEVINAPTGCDELSKLVEAHAAFDVAGPMPGASPTHPRWLLLEGPLKVQEKNNKSNLYGFLFTDALVLSKVTKMTMRDAPDKYRIVRSPMRVDQLEVIELKDGSGFAVLCVDDYNCATCGFVVQPERHTVNQWMDKIRQAKEWYNNACSYDDEEYFGDEGSTEAPDTPITFFANKHDSLHPATGFTAYGSPLISPQHSPKMERSVNRRSNSPSSRGSNTSLPRMDEEENAPDVTRTNVMNGRALMVNNSNNRQVSTSEGGVPNGSLKRKPDSIFLGDDSLFSNIVTNIQSDEQKNKLISTARQLSAEEETAKPPVLSPATPKLQGARQIMSFESDDEDAAGDPPPLTGDIYFGGDKGLTSPKRKQSAILIAHKLPPNPKQHRPSLPNIALHGGNDMLKHKPQSNGSAKTDTGGDGTLGRKKKLWEREKKKGPSNIR